MLQAITPYFPPLYGEVKCSECEKENCPCRGKHQRNKREFMVSSGRCPRLPDKQGFVDKREFSLYAATYPLVDAERGEERLYLTLNLAGEKRNRKVYITKSGYWYFNTQDENHNRIKRIIEIEWYRSEEEIINYMENDKSDHCVLRCEITE